MDVEVIHFEIKPCMRKLAQVLIRYEDIRIKCNLVYHVKDHKAWIRMPEMWSNTKEKMRYCYWESKELSDLFQKKIINIIFNNYNLNLNDLKHMHSKLVKKKTRKKVDKFKKTSYFKKGRGLRKQPRSLEKCRFRTNPFSTKNSLNISKVWFFVHNNLKI